MHTLHFFVFKQICKYKTYRIQIVNNYFLISKGDKLIASAKVGQTAEVKRLLKIRYQVSELPRFGKYCAYL